MFLPEHNSARIPLGECGRCLIPRESAKRRSAVRSATAYVADADHVLDRFRSQTMTRDTPRDVKSCPQVVTVCVRPRGRRTLADMAISEETRRRIRAYVRTLNDDAPPLTEEQVRELRRIIYPRVPRPHDDDSSATDEPRVRAQS